MSPLITQTLKPIYRLNGKGLRKAREERGTSLRALARRLEISPAYLSRLETSGANISHRLAVQISVWEARA